MREVLTFTLGARDDDVRRRTGNARASCRRLASPLAYRAPADDRCHRRSAPRALQAHRPLRDGAWSAEAHLRFGRASGLPPRPPAERYGRARPSARRARQVSVRRRTRAPRRPAGARLPESAAELTRREPPEFEPVGENRGGHRAFVVGANELDHLADPQGRGERQLLWCRADLAPRSTDGAGRRRTAALFLHGPAKPEQHRDARSSSRRRSGRATLRSRPLRRQKEASGRARLTRPKRSVTRWSSAAITACHSGIDPPARAGESRQRL